MSGYRILMIAPTPFFADRGCHVRIAEEARALQALGHRVTLCTYHNGRDLPDMEIRRIPRIPWYHKTSAGPSIHKLYLDLLLMALAVRVARSVRPDVLHGHLHEGAFIARSIRPFVPGAHGRKVPVVFDLQGSLTGELVAHRFVKLGGVPYRVLRWMEAQIDHAADAILPSSVQASDELARAFPRTTGRVEVVSDGVNAVVFRPMPCREEMRLQLGIPAERAVIGYLGILTEYQGIDCLVRAMPEVIGRVPDAHLLLLGWPNVERYRALAEELGVADRVTLAGQVAHGEAPRFLAAADVAVAPKIVTTESNLKVRDYMACALPTVVFDLPVNREILGDLGIYAAERTSEALAASLVTALTNRAGWQSLGARCREVAVRDYSWESAARRITGVYDRLVPGAPALRRSGAPEMPITEEQCSATERLNA
jgi:glycosyltransferase involved in cell wall biosynthesis